MEKRRSALHVLLSERKKRELKEQANRLGINVSALVNLIINDYFKKLKGDEQ